MATVHHPSHGRPGGERLVQHTLSQLRLGCEGGVGGQTDVAQPRATPLGRPSPSLNERSDQKGFWPIHLRVL